MALGFVWSGFDGSEIRKLVQPFACICYATALVAHGIVDPNALAPVLDRPALAAAVLLGGVAGLVLGPKLPGHVIIHAIRGIAAIAGLFLLAQSFR